MAPLRNPPYHAPAMLLQMKNTSANKPNPADFLRDPSSDCCPFFPTPLCHPLQRSLWAGPLHAHKIGGAATTSWSIIAPVNEGRNTSWCTPAWAANNARAWTNSGLCCPNSGLCCPNRATVARHPAQLGQHRPNSGQDSEHSWPREARHRTSLDELGRIRPDDGQIWRGFVQVCDDAERIWAESNQNLGRV